YVTVRQRSGPLVCWFDPAEGPTTGGTDVTMFGEGFAEGATVTFGGEAATNVVVENSAVIHATTPAGTAGTADLVVTNPNGTSTLYEGGFWYFDATPPVLSAAVSGTVGLNGWYTSDVTVQWSISDVESPVQQQDCPAVTLYQDAPEMIARCTATSDGGTASDHVTIKRDATPPMIQLTSPENRVYAQHAAHLVTFVCSDEMSGVASCAGPTTSGSALDTSVTGTFTFTVTADDYAGLRTTRSVTYTVKAEPTIDVPAASAPYGGSALLRATLRRNGVPIGGGVVTFLANGEVAASSTTNTSGEASFLMSLAGRNAGTVN